ncbi:DUF393 domain-containing protein [Cryobacterium sp. TMT1-62]|uniref:DUF393 domain-containing protein n=1 Tax=Cryobacterium sandaracinum TaxID=1259247 RepID=A0ABY2J6Q0_9MICO|nr:DUF393 domain-containing protein [Cryobacterium sp. TMT2-17-1]TFB54528.1 DUF393 domain-containing protein [Cryobacterium sp. Sr3]TFB64428.1 DUF393 domain-containing protein [Cryobacterium sp. Hz7]TFD00613.1 DUF393 domain-containing protein [Cryobacterium sandaracinum]TFD34574.1 DUF393 domain-containing protein [Cryobacterium sp. TMT1-62]TFC49660.1 DUF393 domain-containing protein [Cryobacterium sp. TMT2-17-1]
MIVTAHARPPLLIFDGDCAFCTTSVNTMKRLIPGMPASAPYQWTDLTSYALTTKDAQSRVWLIVDDHRFGGAAAVAALLRHQPNVLMRVLGWLGTVPPWSWAAEVGYRLVARYRHRLPGGTPACRMKPGA